MLLVAGTVLDASVRADVSTDDKDDVSGLLRAIDDKPGDFIAGSITRAIAFLVLIFVLVYLYRAVKARRPELFQAALVLAVAGPLLFAVATILLDLSRVDIADQFVSGGEQTEERAEDLHDDRSAVAVALGAGGVLGLALAFVLLSVNAIRAGVLSRFMGVIGAIAGVLFVIPLGSASIIQVFWLAALGVLFLDRWPGGRGPAWESGEALPWPTAAERRGLVPPGEGAAQEEQGGAEEQGAGEAEDERSGRRPRKRKRRR